MPPCVPSPRSRAVCSSAAQPRPEIAAEYVSVFPRARFVSVPECGHLNWLEQRATYAREIEAFLDDG